MKLVGGFAKITFEWKIVLGKKLEDDLLHCHHPLLCQNHAKRNYL